MTDPVLSIGDLEPLRPVVAIGHNAPDGRWQRWKYNHLDVLLRWMPVRFAWRKELYPLRAPSEFGLRTLQRLRHMQEEIAALQGSEDEAAALRYLGLLREVVGLVLVAPRDVIDRLQPLDLMRVIEVFPRAVMGMSPTSRAPRSSPTISEPPSPDSTASMARGTG